MCHADAVKPPSLPYENATCRRSWQGFDATSFGCLEDFDKGEVIVQFKWRERSVTIRASGNSYAAAWLRRHPYTGRTRGTRWPMDRPCWNGSCSIPGCRCQLHHTSGSECPNNVLERLSVRRVRRGTPEFVVVWLVLSDSPIRPCSNRTIWRPVPPRMALVLVPLIAPMRPARASYAAAPALGSIHRPAGEPSPKISSPPSSSPGISSPS